MWRRHVWMRRHHVWRRPVRWMSWHGHVWWWWPRCSWRRCAHVRHWWRRPRMSSWRRRVRCGRWSAWWDARLRVRRPAMRWWVRDAWRHVWCTIRWLCHGRRWLCVRRRWAIARGMRWRRSPIWWWLSWVWVSRRHPGPSGLRRWSWRRPCCGRKCWRSTPVWWHRWLWWSGLNGTRRSEVWALLKMRRQSLWRRVLLWRLSMPLRRRGAFWRRPPI
mmetsp:Transcript_66990/g.160503  ORF Transcript_66990/g.160503 Transcript_66990/m.160503 type:complete len:217 (-) Transcript_66990:1309-1959(-)